MRVTGRTGKKENGLCMLGCQRRNGEGIKEGQRNMILVNQDTGDARIGKCCSSCIRQSENRDVQKDGPRYKCQMEGCDEEGVVALITSDGRVVSRSLTCGRHVGLPHHAHIECKNNETQEYCHEDMANYDDIPRDSDLLIDNDEIAELIRGFKCDNIDLMDCDNDAEENVMTEAVMENNGKEEEEVVCASGTLSESEFKEGKKHAKDKRESKLKKLKKVKKSKKLKKLKKQKKSKKRLTETVLPMPKKRKMLPCTKDNCIPDPSAKPGALV